MLTPGKIHIGTVVRITIAFSNEAGAPVDPATVKFRTISPSSHKANYVYGVNPEVQRSAIGQYLADVTPTEAGRWRFRWETTGPGTTLANEGDFLVQDSPFFEPPPVLDYIIG